MSKISISLTSVGLAILLLSTVAAKRNPTLEPSGRDIYMDRCSACHGEDGKGDGPAVGALRIAPTDLTVLAQKSGGSFPEEQVKYIIGGWANLTAHGSREMPIWGDLFSTRKPADQQIAAERFKSLVSYLKSIQR